MARLIWSPQAAQDLESICEFIARDSEDYAQEFAQRILAAVEVLAEYSQAGRIVPEFEDVSLRELPHGHYRIIYEVGQATVSIPTIHHGARILRGRPER